MDMARYTNPTQMSDTNRRQRKSCPFCAETIRYEAVKCRFCGEFLYGDRSETAARFVAPEAPVEMQDDLLEDPIDEDENEDNDEDILWCGRPSLFALAGPIVKTGLFIALCWAVYHYRVTAVVPWLGQYATNIQVGSERLAQVEGWLDLGALGLIVVAGLVLLGRILALKSVRYQVTPERIEWSRGIFDRQVDNIDTFRIIDLSLRRSLLEALLGIGTVHLVTKDDSDPYFDFVKVPDCRRLYDIIKRTGIEAGRRHGVVHLE